MRRLLGAAFLFKKSSMTFGRNEKEGIEYSVDELTGLVGLVKYFPAAADNALRCPKPRKLLSERLRLENILI